MLLLLEVYSAGEDPIVGATSKNLCTSLRQLGEIDPIYVEKIEDVPGLLGGLVQDHDLVLTQGAGSVSKLVEMLEKSQLQPVKGDEL